MLNSPGALDSVYRVRARWSAQRIRPWLTPQDRVLDIGAGDCYLDLELNRQVGCSVVPIDVTDTNRTSLPLRIYDGRILPFTEGSFDTGLLLFVLHHAEDPAALLREVMRVCRRRVIAFEDINVTWWDRCMFRSTHRIYDKFLGISYPQREWGPNRWAALAREIGLTERWSGPIGRQFGYLSPRHIMYVWEPGVSLGRTAGSVDEDEASLRAGIDAHFSEPGKHPPETPPAAPFLAPAKSVAGAARSR